MVSFRFYLVSVTAVFLALALGIAMGATVVDRATVSLLETRLEGVRRSSVEANKRSDQLRAELDRWNGFANQADDRLVKGRLAGVPVVVVVTEGSAGDSVDASRRAIIAAGATLQGTLWLTAKLALRDAGDVTALREITNAASARPDDLRRLVASQVANGLTSTAQLAPLLALVDKGYARVEAAGGAAIGPAGLTTEGARYVVISDARAAAPNGELAQPLGDELARLAPLRVIAAEAGRDPKGADPGERAEFVGPFRSRKDIQVSTLDDLDLFAGRVGLVLALQALGEGHVGHYGVGPGASKLLPDTAS
jgi:hypothetical protein